MQLKNRTIVLLIQISSN